MENSLGPERYHWRLPFFAKPDESNPSHVTLPKISQAEIDLEIKQAAYAGIDFWAFVGYGSNDPMSSAFYKYLQSSERHQVKFCFFAELARWGNLKNASKLVEEHIDLMSHDQYAKTADGRPLYFLGFINNQLINESWGGLEGLQRQIQAFRERSRATGAGDPYIIINGLLAQYDSWRSVGGDAIGAYALGDPVGSGSYDALTNLTEQRWNLLAKAGLPVVPTVMAGYDRRPRIDHPVPWERGQKPGQGIQYYYESPSPEQLARHLSHALKFISSQPSNHRSPAALIYAWNENDEGGWLIPTWPCDTARLDSIRSVLVRRPMGSNPGCAL